MKRQAQPILREKISKRAVLSVSLAPWRSRLLLGMIFFAFTGLTAKAVYEQVFNKDFLQKKGEEVYARTWKISAMRGQILDRLGNQLAVSQPVRAIWANPEELERAYIEDKIWTGEAKEFHKKFTALAKALDIPKKELWGKLINLPTRRTYLYIQRQVDLNVAKQVDELDLPGVYHEEETKRFYPQNEVFAHVVGFTNVEDKGQEGIELAQQKELAGQPGSRHITRNRLGQIVAEDSSLRKEPVNGQTIQLALDKNIQYVVHKELAKAMEEHHAKGASAVVLDVETGGILALVNMPTYNPNDRSNLTGAQLRNRAFTDTYEPGSTMKPITVALALNRGLVKPSTIIQTSPGKMTIGSATIGDSHAYGALTVEQVIQKSSNIGTTKISFMMQPKVVWEFLTTVGFGQAPKLGFPGAVSGRLRPYKTWKPIEQATMSYGHGISVSVLQMAHAYTMFARDGELVPLSIYKTEGRVQGTPVISPEVAQSMRKMLEMAAAPGGTAPKAQVIGFRVAGKTGTSHKIGARGGYENRYVASFVGFAPVSKPRVVIAVMVDEPTAGKHYGGDVAAPVFSSILKEILPQMNVMPDAPYKKSIVTDDSVEEST